jgi:hypothetical protein
MTGADAARPFVERAHPEHPSLIDVGHEVDALFGMVNVPNAVWIDERGIIVRPAEPAWPGERDTPATDPPAALATGTGTAPATPPAAEPPLPLRVEKMLTAVRRSKIDRTRYAPAVRDWVAKGVDSRFVLAPDEVIARSQPRGVGEAEGAAHFELGQHLWRLGRRDAARRHFRDAHRLQPDNWTYKRQAWSVEPSQMPGGMERLWQGPVDGDEEAWPYEGDFLTDVLALDGREYYPVPEDMTGP